MGLILEYQKGQTPLDENQIRGLKIKTIATQQQLNEFEQLNIIEAIRWLSGKRSIPDLLSEEFVIALHKKMFGKVWRWAGTLRKTETNIGIAWIKIPVELRILIDDGKFWIDHKVFPPDEIAIRFKHKLVSIHCFPNGNGRHARQMADLIAIHNFGLPAFTWGNSNLTDSNDQRKAYIDALKLADNGNYTALLAFARS
jgi:Fic-DOC domain mobile mystery protein B